MVQAAGAALLQAVTRGPRLLEHTVSLPPSTGLSSPALLWLAAVIAHGKGEERTPRARDFLLSKSGEMKIDCLIFANIPLARDEPHGQI